MITSWVRLPPLTQREGLTRMSEMSLNVDTLFGNVESCNTDQLLFHRLHERDLSSSTLVLDGRSHSFFLLHFAHKISELDITANRLFGPHPKTATYVCIWEIHLGSVKASLSAHQALGGRHRRTFPLGPQHARCGFRESAE